MSVYVYKLDTLFLIQLALKWIWSSTSHIYYVETNCEALLFIARKRVKLTKLDAALNVPSSNYFENEKNIKKIIDDTFEHKYKDFIKSFLSSFNGNIEKYLKAIKRSILRDRSSIYRDCFIYQLAVDHVDAKSTVYIVNKNFLYKSISNNYLLNINGCFSIKYFIDNLVIFLKYVLKGIMHFISTKKIHQIANYETKIILESMYKREDANVEFDVFYDYLKNRDDVLYVLPNSDQATADKLQNNNKPFVFRKNIKYSRNDKYIGMLKFLISSLRILCSTKSGSLELKVSTLASKYNYQFYDLLFAKFKPKYFVKVRFDSEAYHPVATAAANLHNVKHIGYQHASYGGVYTSFCYMDFHYYGLLGKGFKNIYRGFWDTNIKYKVLGPLAADAKKYNYAKEQTNKHLVIGIFPRQAFQLGEYDYEENLTNTWQTIYELGLPKVSIVIKEDQPSIYIDNLKKTLYSKWPIQYKTFYNVPVDDELSCPAADVIRMSDIVISSTYAYSTTTFEALSMKKKVLVLMCPSLPPHPLENSNIPIVSRNYSDLKNSIEWMIGKSSYEYNKMIEPIIDEWSKFSEGDLVQKFLEEIEGIKS